MKTNDIILPVAAFALGAFIAKKSEGAAVGKRKSSYTKEVYSPSEYITEEQFKVYQEWGRTGKVDGKKISNPMRVAALLGTSTSMFNAYFMEQNAKDNKY